MPATAIALAKLAECPEDERVVHAVAAARASAERAAHAAKPHLQALLANDWEQAHIVLPPLADQLESFAGAHLLRAATVAVPESIGPLASGLLGREAATRFLDGGHNEALLVCVADAAWRHLYWASRMKAEATSPRQKLIAQGFVLWMFALRQYLATHWHAGTASRMLRWREQPHVRQLLSPEDWEQLASGTDQLVEKDGAWESRFNEECAQHPRERTERLVARTIAAIGDPGGIDVSAPADLRDQIKSEIKSGFLV